MNHLDEAIKNLQGSLRDIESQQRALEREHGRLAKALALLAGNRPVSQISGLRQSPKSMPDGIEAARRRQVLRDYLSIQDEPFTPREMVEAMGERALYKEYRSLIHKLAGDGEIDVVRPGSGKRPGVYQTPRGEEQS